MSTRPGTAPNVDINAGIGQIVIGKSTLEDVVRILGDPISYGWGEKTYTRDKLPKIYAMEYSKETIVVIENGCVESISFLQDRDYRFRGKIGLGTSLDEAIAVLGKPAEVVTGQPAREEGNVLCREVGGKKGRAVYTRSDQGIILYFREDKVNAIKLGGLRSSTRAAGPIQTLKAFDDVRWADLSKLDLSGKAEILPTLSFNEKTLWPPPERLPRGFNPRQIMEAAKNPGLGVRALHQRGITGKGVSVAIIDQALQREHPEYRTKIADYFDAGCGSEHDSMHGPAVSSLLVGEHCGTAPGARLYYAAAPSAKADAKFYAAGLDWMVAKNAALPAGQKIRVVSVSAGPSDPSWANHRIWEEACQRAERNGILVMECAETPRNFVATCVFDQRNVESPCACTPGLLRMGATGVLRLSLDESLQRLVFAPVSPRTTAEHYEGAEPSYQYDGDGGQSWAVPYAAGVLALGWQVRPDLTPEVMKRLLFESGCKRPSGHRIIHPAAFVAAVERAPKAAADTRPE